MSTIYVGREAIWEVDEDWHRTMLTQCFAETERGATRGRRWRFVALATVGLAVLLCLYFVGVRL